jgi:hypothetical protein
MAAVFIMDFALTPNPPIARARTGGDFESDVEVSEGRRDTLNYRVKYFLM